MITLPALQNGDGGWGHVGGGPSWTEPTAYAALALGSDPGAAEPVARALRWLRAAQLPDGGWPPQPSVAQSNWVGAVVTLLAPAALGAACYRRGIAWILNQAPEESSIWSRLHRWLAGVPPSAGDQSPGWPWFPATSAWVTPTALSMLALRKAARCDKSTALRRRREMGSAYLLAHACSDGGWNYGCPQAFGYDALSYPEITGVALLALHGARGSQIAKACEYAQSQLGSCFTSEAESWLRLGLLAHRRLPADTPAPARPQRSVVHRALALLALQAEQGRNVFLE